MSECLQQLEEARRALAEHQEYIDQINELTASFGFVIEVRPDCAVVITEGGRQQFPCKHIRGLKAGDQVEIVQPGAIRGIDKVAIPYGHISTIKSVLGDVAEVTFQGEGAVVHVGQYKDIKIGERVQLDPSNALVVRRLPPPPAPVLKPSFDRVAWSDIGGHKEAKKAIEHAVVWPMKYASLIKAYGQRPNKGILLWGPPGCGKTMLAKATATAMAEARSPGFFAIKGPELMNMYVGETERAIRELFEAAREQQSKTGTRSVIFIDEADSALGHRGSEHGGGRIHFDISVPAFLVEMDSLDSSNAPLVILATNRAHDLDEAVVREGRIDRRIKIDRPDINDLKQLFGMYLMSRPTKEPVSELAIHSTSHVQALPPLWKERSGAMVASLVDRATEMALERDIKGSSKKPSGITKEDCDFAIGEAAQQHTF